ncbi:deoxynucleoside kinase [Klebsormidium nitens]|uniref:Deoxynucleoside kinase n=1 Tax=Klebsormidium nitens TaxID=105231 RepID=A0A0U9HSY3_KLENI|nr:deoxynucleoside kinase [Klebsormidium nitens]|eukprot:GAQ83246.1 deoxynucleoside kinase [Klebsormidium nitens]
MTSREAAACNASAVNLTRLNSSQILSRTPGTITNSGHHRVPSGNMLSEFRAARRNVAQASRLLGEILGRGSRCSACEGAISVGNVRSVQALGADDREVCTAPSRSFSSWVLNRGESLGARFQRDVAAWARKGNAQSAGHERLDSGAVSEVSVAGRGDGGGEERAASSSAAGSNAAEAASGSGELEQGEQAAREESAEGVSSEAEALSAEVSGEDGLGGSLVDQTKAEELGESSALGVADESDAGGTLDEASSSESSLSDVSSSSIELGDSAAESKRRGSPNGRRTRTGKSATDSSSSRGKPMKLGTENKKDVGTEAPKSKVYKETGRRPIAPAVRMVSEETRRKEEMKGLPATDLLTVKGIGPKTVGNFIEKGITSVKHLEDLYKEKFYKKSEGMVAFLQTNIGVKQQMWARKIVEHVEEQIQKQDSATDETAGAENTRKKPLTFCVEGNISVGKSTFLRQIVTKTILLQELVDISPEPVEKWQSVGDDRHNILESFYKDPQRYAYTFQNYVFFTRMLQAQERPVAGKPLRLMERSVFSDRMVFVRAVHEAKFMSDMEISIYDSWFDPILSAIPTLIPDGFIYLRANPDTCFNRLKKRGRSEEMSVDMDYLQNLHEKHEQWLLPDVAKSSAGHTLLRGAHPEGYPEAIRNDVYSLVNRNVHPLIQGLPALVLDCDPDMDIEHDQAKKEEYADKLKTFYEYIQENPPATAGAGQHVIKPHPGGLIFPPSPEEMAKEYRNWSPEQKRAYA